MAQFNSYQYNQAQITAIAIDTTNGQFLWIAFAKVGTTCMLKKVSANDISQVYFSQSFTVDSINAIQIIGDVIYIAVTHATIAAYAMAVASPLTIQLPFTKTTLGVDEAPICGTQDSTQIYFLTPGTDSGENAKIVTFDNAGAFVETIDLQESGMTVTNATSFTIDSDSDFWVVTENSPSELYRVFYESGGWQLQETIF